MVSLAFSIELFMMLTGNPSKVTYFKLHWNFLKGVVQQERESLSSSFSVCCTEYKVPHL